MPDVAVLSVAFFFLAALALWYVIKATGPWKVKLALILALPLLAFWLYTSLGKFEGWPADTRAPKGSEFLAAHVVEPKAIYVLAVPPGESVPRLYEYSYTRLMHEQVEAGSRGVKAGLRMGVQRGTDSDESPFRLYVLPPPGLPSKG